MNLVIPLVSQENARLIVIIVIALLAIAFVAAVGVFGFSLWRQFKYTKSSLPSLQEEAIGEEEESEESAFDLETLTHDPISREAYVSSLAPEMSYEDLASRKFEDHGQAVEGREREDDAREDFALPSIDFSPPPGPPVFDPKPAPAEDTSTLDDSEGVEVPRHEVPSYSPTPASLESEEEEDDFSPAVEAKRRADVEPDSQSSEFGEKLRLPTGIYPDRDTQSYVGKRRASDESYEEGQEET